MATSRKRKADTILVGFMGHAILGAQNMTSCESIPGRDTWPTLALAPTLEETMRSAAKREAAWIQGDWCDSLEAEALALDDTIETARLLTERGYLP